jgi:hypothetical protein
MTSPATERRTLGHDPRTRDRRAPRPTTTVRASRRITCNARMGTRELKTHCALDETTLALLQIAMAEFNLSARAYDRILKVSRTIADLAGAPSPVESLKNLFTISGVGGIRPISSGSLPMLSKAAIKAFIWVISRVIKN